MRDENILTWNIPNFITVALMLALIWCVLGFAGHMFFRAPAATKGKGDKKVASGAVSQPPAVHAAEKQATQPDEFSGFDASSQAFDTTASF